MKWVISAGFNAGSRWELRDDKFVLAKVFRCGPSDDVEAMVFGNGYSPPMVKTFPTMKEAAEWLVKKVTSGTGAV
jgi:hypothetical protein